MSDFDEMARQSGPMGGPPVLEPKRIKVFGVLHIVFGGLGILGVLSSLAMAQVMGPMLKSLPTAPGMEEYNRISYDLIAKLAPVTYIGSAVQIVLAVLILIAGISLVKHRKQALKRSNLYAYVSLAAKVVSLILFFVLTKPIMDGFLDPFLESAEGGLKTQLEFLKISQALSGILTPVLTAVYPILALVMLNKPVVKEFLATRGT